MRYQDAGVDRDQADKLIELIKKLNPKGGAQIGPFAALYDLSKILKDYREPLLVSSTDGIGTKTRIAVEYGKLDGLGQDLVAMNVNDLVCLGAKPLFFLDYYATAQLDLEVSKAIFTELVKACDEAGCALIGGETAQLPDLFVRADDFELVGFVVGIVERSRIPDPERVEPGDVLMGIASSGPHCNGFSLIRKIREREKLDLRKIYAEVGERPLGELLLAPMPIYSNVVLKLWEKFSVKGAAHITGGGIAGNLVRALNDRVDAVVQKGLWPIPKLFRALQDWGDVPEDELWEVFNMGLGFIVLVPKEQAETVLKFLESRGQRAYRVGEIVKGAGIVVFV
ncbi:phosphoribosylformylglycinamidine cyclo-ligase [Candidatus Acetothermia bacterium]|jgi:phosphoribosylformylglycinamidine cyclo-ligase|nr:phosphoribosylformylglycinamidine cyclo-ligase [Candidatus Acetothermia bacterium]MCI2432003.1 phosphoribosylformylglycinamidine cyclo-ligase [Candidatus Acetothermia bacterium]MCI2436800.1 phosphoribosylformylglycinamidine cyclo-ligase [Candidatus Acetothermia bacterium]